MIDIPFSGPHDAGLETTASTALLPKRKMRTPVPFVEQKRCLVLKALARSGTFGRAVGWTDDTRLARETNNREDLQRLHARQEKVLCSSDITGEVVPIIGGY